MSKGPTIVWHRHSSRFDTGLGVIAVIACLGLLFTLAELVFGGPIPLESDHAILIMIFVPIEVLLSIVALSSTRKSQPLAIGVDKSNIYIDSPGHCKPPRGRLNRAEPNAYQTNVSRPEWPVPSHQRNRFSRGLRCSNSGIGAPGRRPIRNSLPGTGLRSYTNFACGRNRNQYASLRICQSIGNRRPLSSRERNDGSFSHGGVQP
jgi:hypothetical protein